MPKSKETFNLGTSWFLALIILALVDSTGVFPVIDSIVWLIFGFLGAMMALYNIRLKEEIPFLIATTAFLVLTTAMLSIPEVRLIIPLNLKDFLIDLAIAFGVTGFILAIALILKVGLQKS